MKIKKIGILLFALVALTSAKPKKEFNNEPLRPQFHFTPPINWMNDPNGLVFYKGEYHLFYQFNPKGNKWGYMHWGHAVSTDLVHWEYLPIALTPDNDSQDESECTAWSGSCIMDERNVTGLKTGEETTMLAFYTSWKCGQRLAYSNDKGRTWKKYDKNPIIPFDSKDDARDPKVFWHSSVNKYVMVLYRKLDGFDNKKGTSIYTSDNLLNWKYESHINGFFECPDLIEIPINRHLDEKKWVLFDGDGSYIIGTFDGKSFNPESDKFKSDYGKNFYATQTWSNIPKEDGRCIQLAWMRGGEYPGMPFNGQMSFPTELSLTKFKEGVRLCRQPVKEIEKLHDKQFNFSQKNVIPGLNKNLISKVKGDCLHIIGTFDTKTANNFGFILRCNKEAQGGIIIYDCQKQKLNCLGQQTDLESINGKIKLEILLDRSSVEVFANDGKVVMSSCFTPQQDAMDLQLFTSGGELYIDNLDIFTLKSIWNTEEEK